MFLGGYDLKVLCGNKLNKVIHGPSCLIIIILTVPLRTSPAVRHATDLRHFKSMLVLIQGLCCVLPQLHTKKKKKKKINARVR